MCHFELAFIITIGSPSNCDSVLQLLSHEGAGDEKGLVRLTSGSKNLRARKMTMPDDFHQPPEVEPAQRGDAIFRSWLVLEEVLTMPIWHNEAQWIRGQYSEAAGCLRHLFAKV